MTYCARCEGPRRWRLVGRENGNRPLVEYHVCQACGYQRTQLADVTDVLQLARTVLNRMVRSTPAHLDYDDALGHMYEAVWKLYLRWEPGRGVTFTAYASGLLPGKFVDWQRSVLGRDDPKPLAHAVSLDAPAGDGENETGGLAGVVAAVAGDPALDRSPDLVWALTR